MIERLKKILDYYSLTASNFADKIDVPRSSISHLLSGRNKPSLDFIIKVDNAFEEVELDWLIYGNGVFPKKENLFSNSEKNDFTEKNISLNAKNKIEIKNFITSGEEKKLVKIILLYEDGSFNEYQN